MTDAIFQFGTSRFLQAHVALFAHEAAMNGQAVPGITIVQVTSAAERSGRLAAFNDPSGYPVMLRGLQDDAVIDDRIQVQSVKRGLAAQAQWEDLRDSFVREGRWVVSNVGDSGYGVASGDLHPDILNAALPPKGYPAMLTVLLFERWRRNPAPVTVLPCELVRHNGEALKGIVMRLAHVLCADTAFATWLNRDVLWVNSLVDRIVSQPLIPAGAIAEPYALWAVQNQEGLRMPFDHPAVVLTDDLHRHERLKLHILNLGHTVIADHWIGAGRPAGALVRDFFDDSRRAAWLRRILQDEVAPAFALSDLEDGVEDYIATTIDRFRNPFLDHRIADIAEHHEQKLERRIIECLRWARQSDPHHDAPELMAIATRNNLEI